MDKANPVRVLRESMRLHDNRVRISGNDWQLVSTRQSKSAAVKYARDKARMRGEFHYYAVVRRSLGVGTFTRDGEWMIVTLASTENPFKKKRR